MIALTSFLASSQLIACITFSVGGGFAVCWWLVVFVGCVSVGWLGGCVSGGLGQIARRSGSLISCLMVRKKTPPSERRRERSRVSMPPSASMRRVVARGGDTADAEDADDFFNQCEVGFVEGGGNFLYGHGCYSVFRATKTNWGWKRRK